MMQLKDQKVSEMEEQAVVPSTSTGRTRSLKRKVTKPTECKAPPAKAATANPRGWRHADLSKRQKERFPWKNTHADLMNLPSSPVELFECFFDREILETFAEYSKTYAWSKGNMTFSTTPEELQTFLANLLLSGYGPVPRRRMYWSSGEDVGKDCVQSAMSRNRFEEMLRCLHVSDNAHLDVGDKMSKVRPLLSHMNEKFLTYFRAVQSQNLSIDDSMVPYSGGTAANNSYEANPSDLATRCGC